MRKKNTLLKQIAIFVVLSALVLATVLNNLTPIHAVDKLADLDTTMTYQESLGDEYSTQFSGRVWTDKSVFTSDITFADTSKTVAIDTSKEDFLVSFSALATSDQITGQTQSPIDVVFIIDLSGSMSNSDSGMDNGYSRIKNTVDAVNNAIDELMALNPYTRVAVVGFSNTATTLLPLDHYTKTTGYNYFTLNRSTASNYTTTLTTRAVNSSSQRIEHSINVSGGTNIQLGLYQGLNILATNTNIYAEIQGQQVKRTPAVILLSDGAPTYSSSSTSWWAPANNAEDGPGRNIENGSEFNVTANERVCYIGNGLKALMTGAYMKAAVDAAYQLQDSPVKTSIYTIGMGITGLSNGKNEQDLAYATLDPGNTRESTSTNTILNEMTTAWNTYRSGSNVSVNVGARTDRGAYYDDYYNITHPTSNDIASNQNALTDLVDDYYSADNASAVTNAFEALVSTIVSSAPSVPTEIKEGMSIVNSGYITYTDPIGQYMEIKEIKTLIFGNQEWEFDGNVTTDDNVTNYQFQSANAQTYVHGEQNIDKIIIQVTKDSDGNETLVIKVPASLIPLRVNYISKDKDGVITEHTHNAATPLRLVYSVGLQDGVIDSEGVVNRDVVSDAYANAHANSDGTINFYTNRFSSQEEDVIYADGNLKTISYGDATAAFEPAHTNNFYYMIKPEALCVLEGDQYVQVEGTSANDLVDDQTYYYLATYYQGQELVEYWVERNGAQLKRTAIISQDGYLYRADGSPRVNRILKFDGSKESNPTQTAAYFYYPTFEYAPNSTNPYEGQFIVYLGNNGVLSAHASGTLKISKDVVVPAGLTPAQDEFTFRLTLTHGSEELKNSYSAKHFDENGNTLHTSTITSGASVTLKDGEYIEIYNLAPNTSYVVSELSVAGFTTTSTNASGTIVAGATSHAQFVNTYGVTPISSGNVAGTKHLEGREFNNNDAYSFTIAPLNGGPAFTNPTIEITPTDGEEATFDFGQATFTQPGIYEYQVSENAPLPNEHIAGVTYSKALYKVVFTVVDDGEGGLVVTKEMTQLINDEGNALNGDNVVNGIYYTNIYDASSTKLNLAATKNYIDNSAGYPLTDGMFTFVLEGGDGSPMPQITTVTNVGTSITFPEITFDKDVVEQGTSKTFTYTMKEVASTVPGMEYDANVIEVKVTVEHTSDAEIKITNVTYNNMTQATFTNMYTPEATTANLAVSKVLEGRAIKDDEFTFTLTPKDNAPMPSDGTTSVTNKGADVTFPEITYDKVGTYEYVISEVVGDLGGVTYDTKEIVATVVVSLDRETGKLSSSVTYNLDDPTFVNKYEASKTDPITVNATKQITGKNLVSGEYFFVIEHDNEKRVVPNTDEQTNNITLLNQITFDEVGEYTYKVYEQIPTGATLVGEHYVFNGITYDNTYYMITITVSDTGTGQLAYSTEVKQYPSKTTVGIDEIVFSNKYETASTSIVVPTFNKVLDGFKEGGLKENDFIFYLYIVDIWDEEGVKIEDRNLHDEYVTSDDNHPIQVHENGIRYITQGNGADGTISFGNLTFHKPGTIQFRVAEENTNADGVTYSDNVIDVTYKIEDNGKGQLVDTIISSSGEYTFTNKYETEGQLIGETDLVVEKIFTGRENDEWEETDSFTFELFTNHEETAQAIEEGYIVIEGDKTITIDAKSVDHKNHFGDITFTKPGNYQFTIREVAGDIPGVNYDTTARTVYVNAVDNGDGTLGVYVGRQSSRLTFNNIYDTTSVTLSGHDYLDVNKEISGREWKEGDSFTFKLELHKQDVSGNLEEGTQAVEIMNDTLVIDYNNHGATHNHFENIQFNAPGTYTFRIYEVIPDGQTNGMTYDSTIHYVSVEVIDNTEGLLVVSKVTNTESIDGTAITGNTVEFTNIYKATEVPVTNIEIGKELTGRSWLDSDSFSFTLVAGDEKTIEAVQNHTVIFEDDENKTSMNVTITNASTDHKAQFGKVVFKESGTYTFHVTEDDVNGIEGVAKDTQTLQVVISVVDNQEGNLVVDATAITYIGNQVFTNKFTPNPIDVSFIGTKQLEGRTLNQGEFRFSISAKTEGAPLPGSTVVVNSKEDDNNVTFGPIRYTKVGTYTYIITEMVEQLPSVQYDTTPVEVNVVVEQGDDGQLEETITYTKGETGTAFVFTNYYEATDSKPIAISASKVVSPTPGNIHTMEGGEFTFALNPTGDNNPLKDIIYAQNNMNGHVALLENLVFEEAGTYTYEVNEVNSENSVYIYDSSIYKITVEVVDNTTTGQLDTDVTITKNGVEVDAIVFNNGYQPGVASVVFNGHKELVNNHDRELREGEFTFVLTAKEGAPLPEVTTTTNTEGGLFQFDAIVFDTEGVYTYEIYEQVPGDAITGVTYDSTIYEIVVTVTNVDDQLVASTTQTIKGSSDVVEEINFTNTYAPIETSVSLRSGRKQLIGRDILETDGFRFVLKDEAGEELEFSEANPEGIFEFGNLTFTKAGTYQYTISEVNGSVKGVEYDLETLYTIIIEVVDEQGQLEATTTYYLNGEIYEDNTINFVNTYTTQPTAITIGLSKVLEGKTMKANEFEFMIQAVTEQAPLPEATIVSNNENGQVSFGEIQYDAAGVYVYEISEVNLGVPGVEYDNTVYMYTVEVTDDLNGQLHAQTSITSEDEVVESMRFMNVYHKPDVSISKLQVIKGKEYDTEDGIVLVQQGELVTYVLTVTAQEGKATATNVVVTDEIPEGLELVSIGENGSEEEGIISWNIGDLPAGQSVDVSFTIKVPVVEVNTQWENIATLSFDNGNEVEEKESNIVEIKVELDPELTPVKTQQVNDGEATTEKEIIQNDIINNIKYVITVSSKAGTNDATNVVVTDKLPKGTTLVDGSISHGGVLENGVVTWTIDTLKAGETIELSFEVEVAIEVSVKEIDNDATVEWNGYEESSNKVEIDVETPPSNETGDENNIALIAGAFAISAVGLIALTLKRRKED